MARANPDLSFPNKKGLIVNMMSVGNRTLESDDDMHILLGAQIKTS